MFGKSDSSSTSNPDMIKVALNTLYLCLESAVEHIEQVEGSRAAAEFKSGLLDKVKDGSVDMALLEDAAIYDFVVPKIEKLLTAP